MKLALIPPVQLLQYTERSNIQLMLPHMLRNSTYAERYSLLVQMPDQYVIMDNGAAEKEQFDNEALTLIANTYKVDEFVMPDVMGDMAGTIGQVWKYLDEYDQWGLDVDIKLAAVAQGRDTKEALQCVRECMMHSPGDIEVVHIPRLLVTRDTKLARLELAAAIAREYPGVEIHLLGASKWWPQECAEAAKSPWIRSMDTSMPFVYGMHQRRVNQMELFPPPHRDGDDDYFFRIWSATEELYSQYNLEDMFSWVRG